MSAVSLAIGIVMLLAIQFAWTTMGPIRSGFVFGVISLVCILLVKNDKKRTGLGTAAIIVNIIAMIINCFIAFAHIGR